MLTGENGILTQAKQAKEETEEAEKKEIKMLAQLEANTHLDNYEYTTEDNIKVPVQAGYAVIKEEGKKISDGIVIIDAKGNEYVWIPCTKEEYKRQEWGVETDGADNSRASRDELTLTVATFSQNDINNGTKNYATSTNNFNQNWQSKEVKDKNGNIIKPAGTQLRLKTRLTTAKSNIYDMGGNVTEFTTELNPNTFESVVFRGGYYLYNDVAGHRFDYNAGYADSTSRFSCHFIAKIV